MIVGEEVPHTHLHVVPINNPMELSFAHVDRDVAPEVLDDAAARIRAELRALGAAGSADAPRLASNHGAQRQSSAQRGAEAGGRVGRADAPPEQVATVDQ